MRILGISFDTVEENRAFAAKFGFNFPLLCDTSREVGLAYGACDTNGARSAKRISYWIDANGVVKKAYPKVDAASQPEQILADIQA